MSHDHSHSHSGACSHHHPAPDFSKGNMHAAFGIGIALNLIFVAVELFYGWKADSLALVADAVHNLGDVLGLVVAWLGYALAQKAPTPGFTFGFGRMSIYATVINGGLLVASSVWILYEAWERFGEPQLPHTGIVVVVATIGILINIGTALALQRGQHDINVKGAFLHMVADAAVSAAVVVAAIVISYTGWSWVDPALSLVLAVFIFVTSWPLFWEGLRLAADGVPRSVNSQTIKDFMMAQTNVAAVNDLRIWAISTTKTALSAHVTISPGQAPEAVLAALRHQLSHEFGLASITLQLEHDHNACL